MSNQLALVPGKGAVVQKTEEEIKAEEEKKKQELEEFQAKLKFIQEMVPTKVYNTMSSTAGAGSGEFHIYRLAKQREQARLARIDSHMKKQAEEKAYLEKQQKLQEASEAKTEKNRKRRAKKKEKQKAKRAKKGASGDEAGDTGRSAGEESDEESEGEGQQKEEEQPVIEQEDLD